MLYSPADVSVIIPAVNEAEFLSACIRSAQLAGANEIIVSDGGSTDASCDIAASLGAIVVSGNSGRGPQQNAGVQKSTHPLLCFLHADCLLGRSSLETLCIVASQKEDLYACFRQSIAAAGTKYRLLEIGNDMRVRWQKRPYGDQGICISRALYQRVGGFEDVPFMEDVLLAGKLRQLSIAPCLLNDRIEVSPRRWQRSGVIRQTLKNWSLLRQLKRGRSPNELIEQYARDDEQRRGGSE